MADNIDHIEEESKYTDEFKAMLDSRYEDCISGRVQLLSAEESERQVMELLARKNKPDAF